MKKLLEQIIKFGIVGVICFIIDFAITTIPTYFFGQNTVYVSAVFGFVISCIVNYLLSIKFLNELIPDSLIVPISKIIATGVVMVYNFISRKIFLEGKKTKKEDAQVQDLFEGKV